MQASEVLRVIEVVERVGVPAAKSFIEGLSKPEVTVEDWEELESGFSKSSTSYFEDGPEGDSSEE